MKKSSKKAVPAPVVPKMPTPPPVFRTRLHERLERQIDGLRAEGSNLARFLERAKESLADAFKWSGEEALRDSVTADALARLFAFSTKPFSETRDGFVAGEVPSDEKIVEVLRGMADDIRRDLLGDYFYVSSRGPWSACSTSAFSNIVAQEKANADRSLFAFYTRAIEEYETRAKFDAAMDFDPAFALRALEAAGFTGWTVEFVAEYRAAQVERAEAQAFAEAHLEAAEGLAAVEAIRAENRCAVCGSGPLCGPNGYLCPSITCETRTAPSCAIRADGKTV